MLKKLILLVISMCFILLACELIIRYLLHAWPLESELYIPNYLTTSDMTLRWRFSHSDGRNSLGLKNREIGPKKTGTIRILFLGDSMIWFGETSSGKLFTEVLEQRLNFRIHKNPNTIEVINAGVPGYTTYQELEFLKIYGIDMKPDLVVLGFVFNDLYYKYLHRPTDQKLLNNDPNTQLFHFNPSAFPGLFFARSYLAHKVVYRSTLMWKRMFKKPIFPFEQREDFYLAWKSYGWNKTRMLIDEMQSLLKDEGISLIVVVFPISDQVNEKYRKLDEIYVLYPQGKIREICDAFGLPMLDLTETIYRNGGITLFQDYLHLNTKGNDIVTNELETYLTDRVE